MSTLLAAGVLLMVAAQEKPPAQTPPPSPPKEASPAPPPTQAETIVKSLAKQITLGGQIRTRAEYRDPTSYANTLAATRSDDLFLTRIRLNFKFSVTDDIDVFVQPQDQRMWGQEPSVLYDDKNFDLHQGFVELRNLLSEPLSIKAGRMELSYGDQRLVSPLDWSNIARSWDGAKIRYAPKDWWIEGFYTVIRDPLAPVPAGAAPPLSNAPLVANGAGHDQDFMGVYFSYVGIADHEFDAYAFFREFQDDSFVGENGVAGDIVDRTIGARFKGKHIGFDYTGEVMSQTGHYSQDYTRAYAFAATLGYTVDMDWKPRIGVEYDYASGDRHPADGKRGTFDPLYPFGHYYQGFADTFAFRNGHDMVVFLKVAPTDTLSIHLDVHQFILVDNHDAWYNFAGNAIRPKAAGNPDRKVGWETDLHARLAVGKNVKFWGGWSHFFAGPYVRQTATPVGTDVDMNWFFVQMTVDF
jgi:hypothetical protein